VSDAAVCDAALSQAVLSAAGVPGGALTGGAASDAFPSRQRRDLSQLERAILEFERTCWSTDRTRDQEIRQRFDLSSARYHQVLNALIDQPAALEADPLLVKRLLRLRDARQRSRSASRLR